MLLHLRLRKLSTRISFRVAPHLAVEIILGTSFTDRLVRGIFSSERKVVPWHPQAVAILVHKRTPQDTHKSSNVSPNPAQGVDHNVCPDTGYDAVRLAKKVVLQPHTQHHVLVSTKSNGGLTSEP